jgi:hypothetical protein
MRRRRRCIGARWKEERRRWVGSILSHWPASTTWQEIGESMKRRRRWINEHGKEERRCWGSSIQNLAEVLQDQGKDEVAEERHRRALEGYEKNINTVYSVSDDVYCQARMNLGTSPRELIYCQFAYLTGSGSLNRRSLERLAARHLRGHAWAGPAERQARTVPVADCLRRVR